MNEEHTLSLEELGEIKTVKVYNQAYVDKQQERIETLERENAELKEKLKPENCLKLLAKEGYIKFTSDKLTKAKELLRYYFECFKNDNKYTLSDFEVVEDTEQFLSEVEK